jgi:hypothetical protein
MEPTDWEQALARGVEDALVVLLRGLHASECHAAPSEVTSSIFVSRVALQILLRHLKEQMGVTLQEQLGA